MFGGRARIRLVGGALSALLLAAPGAVGAAEEEADELGYVRDGWYVGVAGVNAIQNWQGTRGISVSDAMGVHAYLGYRFLEHWAIDVQYERILEFRLRSIPRTQADANVLTLNGRAYLPLGRLAPYALLGLGLHQTDINDNGTPFDTFGGGEQGAFTSRMGAGLDLYLTEHLVGTVSATYVLPWEKDNNKLQYLSVGWGLQWRFDPFEY